MDERSEPKPRSLAAKKEMLSVLASEDWEGLLGELVQFAYKTLRNRVWVGVWGGHVPGAVEAHDIVMESVVDIIEGTRSAKEGVPLVAVLKSIIRSKISHLATSVENRQTSRLDSGEDDRELDKRIAALHPTQHGTEPLGLVSKETEAINARLIDMLIDHLSDEPELQKIIECNIDGVFKREEIAERMGKSVSEITNLKKRLDRRLASFRMKVADQNPFVETKK